MNNMYAQQLINITLNYWSRWPRISITSTWNQVAADILLLLNGNLARYDFGICAGIIEIYNRSCLRLQKLKACWRESSINEGKHIPAADIRRRQSVFVLEQKGEVLFVLCVTFFRPPRKTPLCHWLFGTGRSRRTLSDSESYSRS